MYVLNNRALKCKSRNKPNLKETDVSRNTMENLTYFYHKLVGKADKIFAGLWKY